MEKTFFSLLFYSFFIAQCGKDHQVFSKLDDTEQDQNPTSLEANSSEIARLQSLLDSVNQVHSSLRSVDQPTWKSIRMDIINVIETLKVTLNVHADVMQGYLMLYTRLRWAENLITNVRTERNESALAATLLKISEIREERGLDNAFPQFVKCNLIQMVDLIRTFYKHYGQNPAQSDEQRGIYHFAQELHKHSSHLTEVLIQAETDRRDSNVVLDLALKHSKELKVILEKNLTSIYAIAQDRTAFGLYYEMLNINDFLLVYAKEESPLRVKLEIEPE